MKAFFKGLALAATGGAITAASVIASAPTYTFRSLGAAAAAGALTAVIGYLVKSPRQS